jgi:hypothetical protein
MTIRTVEELSDFLADELAWRKKELADLRALAENNTNKEGFSRCRGKTRAELLVL